MRRDLAQIAAQDSAMKIVVRIEPITDWGEVNTIEVGRIDRPSQTLDPESAGLSLADGKQLPHTAVPS
ncbi:hypothetical protein PQR01_34965, partial [Paraburkholderia rhynchosiae]